MTTWPSRTAAICSRWRGTAGDLRALCRSGHTPSSARQRTDDATRNGGESHLSHEYRLVPADGRLCAPFRMDRHRTDARALRANAGDAGAAAAPSRPLPELVRHLDARDAAARLRFDRGQRQPVRPFHRARRRVFRIARNVRRRIRENAPQQSGGNLLSPRNGAGFRLSVRLAASSVPYRVSRRRATTRQELLRPVRVRIAAREPLGDRERRRSVQPLGRARQAVLRGRQRCRYAFMVRLDVRISDAVAGARGTARQRARQRRVRGDS